MASNFTEIFCGQFEATRLKTTIKPVLSKVLQNSIEANFGQLPIEITELLPEAKEFPPGLRIVYLSTTWIGLAIDFLLSICNLNPQFCSGLTDIIRTYG